MKTLSIDIETYSSADLNKCGVYKYSESPDFSVLLFGYAADGGEVSVVDLALGEMIPDEVMDVLHSGTGGVNDLRATAEKLRINLFRHTVRTDHDHRAFGEFGRTFDFHKSQTGKALHFLAVVHQLTETIDRSLCGKGLFRKFDRS